MCLYSRKQKPLVAAGDITCYKILNKNQDDALVTPCRLVRIEKTPCMVKASKPGLPCPCEGGLYEVGGEGVHAYDTFEEAKLHLFGFRVIAEATVPAGTEFWEDKTFHEIAARRMIINRIIK